MSSKARVVQDYRAAKCRLDAAELALKNSKLKQEVDSAKLALTKATEAVAKTYKVDTTPGGTTKLDESVTVKRPVAYQVKRVDEAVEFLGDTLASALIPCVRSFAKSAYNAAVKDQSNEDKLKTFYETFVVETVGNPTVIVS